MPEHMILRKEKNGFLTMECNFSICFYQGPSSSNFGCACLKDKRASIKEIQIKKSFSTMFKYLQGLLIEGIPK